MAAIFHPPLAPAMKHPFFSASLLLVLGSPCVATAEAIRAVPPPVHCLEVVVSVITTVGMLALFIHEYWLGPACRSTPPVEHACPAAITGKRRDPVPPITGFPQTISS